MKTKFISITAGLLAILLFVTWPDPDYQLDEGTVKIIKIDNNFSVFGQQMQGITIYPFIIICPPEDKVRLKHLIIHEQAHIIQQKREGFLFLFKYYFYWIVGMSYHYFILDYSFQDASSSAYFKIPYEVDAEKYVNKKIAAQKDSD